MLDSRTWSKCDDNRLGHEMQPQQAEGSQFLKHQGNDKYFRTTSCNTSRLLNTGSHTTNTFALILAYLKNQAHFQ